MYPSASAATMAELIARRARTLHHRPLLTCYDDRTGGRTELSYATAANWGAKTAHLLAEDLELAPGDTVALDVDGHWTAVVVGLACWMSGLGVAGAARPHEADIVCVHTSRLDRHRDGPVLVVGDGLRAEPLEPLPTRSDVVVLGDDVHAFADEYDTSGVDGSAPALVVGDRVHDQRQLLTDARHWSTRLGDEARVGLGAAMDTAPALRVLAGAVAAGGSVVAARGPVGQPWQRWATERVTTAVAAADLLADAPAGVTAIALDS